MSAIQSYASAAKLGTVSNPGASAASGATPNPLKDSGGGSGFKSELSSVSSALDGIKQTGAGAEKHITAQIFGTGNVEKTAMSLQELNTHMEIVSQALRMAVEKINELTTRTMGG